jgi:uncharacterized protein GlcG (DUF336 family)
MNAKLLVAAAIIAISASAASAAEATFAVKSLTPETALTAARAALEQCRKDSYQIAVAVVDRSGILQVLLRDRFAGPHTVDAALNKAWTAISFRVPTASLAVDTQPGQSMSALRSLPRVLAAGGGQVIEGGGSLFGGIGVSGGPGGETDDACAKAGIKAIADLLEF